MPTFRVKFRLDKNADEMIEANSMNENRTSYVFYDGNGNIVSQVPRDVVLFVTEEKA